MMRALIGIVSLDGTMVFRSDFAT